MSRSREWRIREAALEFALVHARECVEIRSRDFGSRRKRRILRRARKAHIPGTHVLADVTAEEPIAHLLALRLRKLSVVLDREIRDTRPRIEIARPDECLCRARIETAPARAAAVRFERQIRREVGVRQNDADERERADLGMDEHHVLTDPSESRELRQLPFGYGTGVDVAARRRGGGSP